MSRPSTTLAAAIFALGFTSTALARETIITATTGSAQIADQGGIQATGEVIFQDIVIAPQVSAPIASSSSMTNVTITGPGGDAVSLAVPQTFKVISAATGETVTVVTTTSGDYAAITGLQSLLSSGGQLSVDVGGAIHIIPEQLRPGDYEGLLVFVAQFN